MNYTEDVRFSNFIASKIQRENGDIIRIGTLDGGWAVEMREDMAMFAFFDSCEGEMDMRVAELLITNIWAVCCMRDAEFHMDINKAINALMNRVPMSVVSDEEDKAILDEMQSAMMDQELYEKEQEASK